MIHAQFQVLVIPLAFFLMEDHTTDSYVVALNMLKCRLDSIVYIPEIAAQQGLG